MADLSNLSPQRNPRSVDNGIFSQSHHASRDDLRNALEGDRVFFLDQGDDFWTKLLSTSSTPSATVDSIRESIKADVNQLVNLSKRANPQESDMYPSLVCFYFPKTKFAQKHLGEHFCRNKPPQT